MLTVICGPENSSRDKVFCQQVSAAVTQGREVLVIVPDQYSFESDKKLYKVLGASSFNRIDTAGFNRLAELIMRTYGKALKRNAAENTRIITMYKAVSRFRSEKDAHYYRSSLEKSRFITEMLRLTSEFIRSGIAPEDVRSASERVEGSLAMKLYDVSKLYEYYLDELSEAGLRDSLSALADAIAVADEFSHFAGKAVFVDGFTDFSVDEFNMLRCIMRQGADVTVSLLCCDRPSASSGNIDDPFVSTVRTRTGLIQIAEELNVETERISVTDISSDGRAVSVIDKAYTIGEIIPSADKNGIAVIAANDIYDETEYVCAEIERLVRNEGYSYSDIAVSARQLGVAAPVLEGVFERYEIPYFIDRRVSASGSVLVIFLNSLFECLITREYRTPALFKYLRSPLCPVLDIDITDLEDHCITYGIDRSMWLEPFDKYIKCSPKLEMLRKKIIDPFEKFKSAASDASAADMCKAFFALLEELDISRQVYSVVRRAAGSSNETQLEFARANKQLWQSVLGVFNSIYDDLGNEKISLRRFYELFKLMSSQLSIASPPQKLDSVRCVDAESSRLDNVRALFVIETNDGVFPADPSSGGLFTEREKQLLADMDLPMSNTALRRVENERLVVYRTLCMPRDRLSVLYSRTDGRGKLREPSEIVRMLMTMFTDLEVTYVSDLPTEFFCTSYPTAYYKYLEHNKDKIVKVDLPDISNADRSAQISKLIEKANSIASVEQAVMNDSTYASKLVAFGNYKEDTDYRISASSAKELFFRNNSLTLSPSRINDYYSCPFSFFVNSGLKLRAPSRIVLDQLHKGNYLHRCLESLMTTESDGKVVYNKNFVMYTDEQLKEKIHIAFLKYEYEEIGGSYGKTASYQKEKELYEQTVFNNTKLIQTEFSRSAFEPAYFEYKLLNENGKSLLSHKLSDELTVNISGTVDRADVFTDTDGKKYLRIVDYKTGKTTFQLEAIYHGLNLQLLIYLLAMTQEDYIPAGVMYSHIRETSAKLLPDEHTDEKEQDLRLKSYKPDGMIVGQDNILGALCKEYAGAFTPFGFTTKNEIKKSGRQPVTLAFLKASEEFAKRKVLELADKLSHGSVPASPVINGRKDPCSYCDHYAVCGRVHHGDPSLVLASDKEKCIEEINKLAEESEGGKTDA